MSSKFSNSFQISHDIRFMLTSVEKVLRQYFFSYIKNSENIHLFKVNNRSTEKGVKYVQSQQYRHQNDVNNFVLVSILLAFNTFHTFCSVSIVDLEQVKNCWKLSWIAQVTLNIDLNNLTDTKIIN